MKSSESSTPRRRHWKQSCVVFSRSSGLSDEQIWFIFRQFGLTGLCWSTEHLLDGPGLQHSLPAAEHRPGSATVQALPQDGHRGRLRRVSRCCRCRCCCCRCCRRCCLSTRCTARYISQVQQKQHPPFCFGLPKYTIPAVYSKCHLTNPRVSFNAAHSAQVGWRFLVVVHSSCTGLFFDSFVFFPLFSSS